MSDTPRNFPQKVDFLFVDHAYYNGKGKIAMVATIVAMLRTSPWLGTAWIDTHFEKPLVLCSHVTVWKRSIVLLVPWEGTEVFNKSEEKRVSNQQNQSSSGGASSSL